MRKLKLTPKEQLIVIRIAGAARALIRIDDLLHGARDENTRRTEYSISPDLMLVHRHTEGSLNIYNSHSYFRWIDPAEGALRIVSILNLFQRSLFSDVFRCRFGVTIRRLTKPIMEDIHKYRWKKIWDATNGFTNIQDLCYGHRHKPRQRQRAPR